MKNSQESTYVGDIFNKVAHVLSYDLCGIFKNIYFLIIPQNLTALQRKQISKVT